MSLPSRERGLKFATVHRNLAIAYVAPFTGAWIEIARPNATGQGLPVAPFTGAWIEISLRTMFGIFGEVAPFTGAWIEIVISCAPETPEKVAPFTGAWIEIPWPRPLSQHRWSLPSRERGLKSDGHTLFKDSFGRSLHGSVD